ncbi:MULTISPECIES: StbB family protein [Pseudomonadaceae]|uniref:StbB family protein n=1 Tax=Pseudomonadaceae TaxID=135621 RepID=UPI001C81C0DD|nr:MULTISPECIES: StbB family protein [Pseudomonas]
MRIAIVNLGGNQGKTTLAVNLFSPRMPEAKILAVETINAAGNDLGVDVEKMRGDQFSRIYAELAATDDLILDVGASNIEDFLLGLETFEDGHDEVDLFVIPATPAKKERAEAVKTAVMLSDLGVEAPRIAIVFNRTSDVEGEFADVLNFAKQTGKVTANPDGFIPESELFSLLADKKINISQALDDQTDWKAELKAARIADDKKSFQKAVDMVAIQKMSKAMDRQLQHVFELLTAGAEG